MAAGKNKNLFCAIKDLKNEAAVEALFVERFLKALNNPDSRVSRKESITQISIGKGSKKENYRPDYVLLNSAGEPILVLDANYMKPESGKFPQDTFNIKVIRGSVNHDVIRKLVSGVMQYSLH